MEWQLAGSVAAVALLVMLAWRWGFTGLPELRGEGEARQLADEVPGGFTAVALSLDRSRHGALLRDAAGRIVLVSPAGAHFTARLLGPDFKATRSDGELTLHDRGVSVRLDLGREAKDWEEAIARLE